VIVARIVDQIVEIRRFEAFELWMNEIISPPFMPG
jgi:hypothetical protein